MCKQCQGFWKQGRGATRLVQIIGRNRGKRVSLQLIMDEPGPPVARIRVSHSNDRGPVGQMIWASILILAVNFGSGSLCSYELPEST